MLEILYQDEYLIAVNKPAGMLVHRSWLDKHETQFVMQTLRDEDTVVMVEGDDIGDGAECDQIQKFAQIRFSKVV